MTLQHHISSSIWSYTAVGHCTAHWETSFPSAGSSMEDAQESAVDSTCSKKTLDRSTRAHTHTHTHKTLKLCTHTHKHTHTHIHTDTQTPTHTHEYTHKHTHTHTHEHTHT